MFTVRGVTDDGREVSVSWYAPDERRDAPGIVERGLVDDRDLVVRAVTDEILGRGFNATPEGPCFVSNLDDPRATFVQLASYFRRPRYRVDGSPPEIDTSVPEGAIP